MGTYRPGPLGQTHTRPPIYLSLSLSLCVCCCCCCCSPLSLRASNNHNEDRSRPGTASRGKSQRRHKDSRTLFPGLDNTRTPTPTAPPTPCLTLRAWAVSSPSQTCCPHPTLSYHGRLNRFDLLKVREQQQQQQQRQDPKFNT